jgi:hypothetical protein
MDSITDADYKTLRDNAQELLLDRDLIRHYLDTGDPIEELEIALDKAQGYTSIAGSAQFIVIKVRP